MPLQSQVIPIRVPQKRCFFGTFLKKILFLTHFGQINPPPNYTPTESCASQLSARTPTVDFFEPAGRQNFANTWIQNLN